MDELYYLIGVRYSDATLMYKKYWRKSQTTEYEYVSAKFSLTVRDEDFCEKFAKCLNKVFNNGKKRRWIVNKMYITKKVKGHTYPNLVFYRCGTGCRKDVEYLIDKCNNLNINSLTINQQIEILRGLFDGDGSVSVYEHKRSNGKSDLERVITYGKKPSTVKMFTNLLDNLEIKYSIKEKRDKHQNTIIKISKEGFIKMYTLFGNKLTIKRKDKKIKQWFKDIPLNKYRR